MNTNIVVSMDFRRKKKDGTYPLTLRLGHNASTTTIPLNISVKEADWDESSRVIKKTYKGSESVERLNNILQKRRAEAMDIILKLNEAGKLASMSMTDIRNHIVKKSLSTSFFIYTKRIIEELKDAKRIGTARSFKGVVAVLKTFNKEKDLEFKDINYNYLKKFESYHLGKGNSLNGLAVYMRSIRAIFNRAIKEAVAEKEQYPFDSYKIKTTPTVKRALDADLLNTIITKDIPTTSICFDPRNYFVASLMMYGMNFSDMAYLKKSDIVDGRIQYRRRKTSKLYDIKITKALDEILQHYIKKNPDSFYVFPILKRETAELQDRDIQWARKRYNKKLKKLAELCEIKQNLTSYVSRHSFATQAMMLEVPINAISAMLGHSSIKTTEIYLKSLPVKTLDDYNALIFTKTETKVGKSRKAVKKNTL